MAPLILTFVNSDTLNVSMCEHRARFATYDEWTLFDIQQPHALANAGFFCEDVVSGLVECYHCGLLLNCWKTTDSPMVEHIRHSPTCDFVHVRYAKDVIDFYSVEYDASLDKEEDFLNIEGNPTFNQYLMWINYMKRHGVKLHYDDQVLFTKWIKAKKTDAVTKDQIIFLGYETVEKRLKTLLHVKCDIADSKTALLMALDGVRFSSMNPDHVQCVYCGQHSLVDASPDNLSHYHPCAYKHINLSSNNI